MRKQRNAGYTLIEVVVASLIMAFLAHTLVESSNFMSRLTSTGNVRTVLQIESEKAMRKIVEDLRQSGYKVSAGGKEFPNIFEDGNADGDFAAHAHQPADSEAEDGDLDFGPNLEIVFAQPEDADNDGRPDLDAGGLLVWSADEISYTVRTRSGTNYLERSVNLADTRPVCRFVERITFDRARDNLNQFPTNSMRVRLFLRARDSEGALYRHTSEVVVQLRNGGIDVQ